MTRGPSANYTPAIFDVRDVDEARRIILTAEAGTTTDERWAKETPWLADRIQSGKFAAVSPPMLDLMIARGFRAELAIAIWVLQHVAHPGADVQRLQRVLVPGGGVFVANNLRRAVPTDRGWAHDGVDIEGLLARSFVPAWRGTLPPEIGGDVLPHASFLAAYRNPGPAAMAPTQL